jgi:osmotically-inducible protein OsmY
MDDQSSQDEYFEWLEYGKRRNWLPRACASGLDYVAANSEHSSTVQERKLRNHSGKGPKNYKRSDAAIEDELFSDLTHSRELDASDIDISVEDGVVTLKGFVDTKYERRLAEQLAERIPGVKSVSNQLKFKQFGFQANPQPNQSSLH